MDIRLWSAVHIVLYYTTFGYLKYRRECAGLKSALVSLFHTYNITGSCLQSNGSLCHPRYSLAIVLSWQLSGAAKHIGEHRSPVYYT